MSNTFKIKTSTTVADLLDEGIIDSISQLYTAKVGKKGKASNESGTCELIAPAPANIDEMNAFMKFEIANAPAGTVFKTNAILEGIFGKGKVPSPGTVGRDIMDKLWHMVSPNWRELVKEGFVVKGDKRGQYVGDAIQMDSYLDMIDELEVKAEDNIPSGLVEDEVEVDLDGLSFDDLD